MSYIRIECGPIMGQKNVSAYLESKSGCSPQMANGRLDALSKLTQKANLFHAEETRYQHLLKPGRLMIGNILDRTAQSLSSNLMQSPNMRDAAQDIVAFRKHERDQVDAMLLPNKEDVLTGVNRIIGEAQALFPEPKTAVVDAEAIIEQARRPKINLHFTNGKCLHT